MTYATGGTGGTIVDLMDALRTFAIGEGWTIDKWDSANKLLFMTKGICAVTMGGFTNENVNVYSGVNGSGTFAAQADHRLRFALNDSNNSALTTYYSHPSSVVTSQTDSDAPYVNGLNGPYLAWHFFSDPTVSDHIHCVVQIGSEMYMHFSLGFVDPKGLSHSGVAYVTATPNPYYRNVSNYTTATIGSMSDQAYVNHPFACTNSNNSFQPANYDDSPPIILKNSDAWPSSWLGPIAGANGSGNLRGLNLPALKTRNAYLPSMWPASNNNSGSLLALVIAAEAAPYSNILPLFPVPVFKNHYDASVGAASRRICYVGDFPNIRLCNMSNLTPGQEVTLGADTYKVFPALRQDLWSNRLSGNIVTSGQWAVAYKKVA